MITPVPDYGHGCISNVIPAIALALSNNRNSDGWPDETQLLEKMNRLPLTMDTSRRDWIPKVITEATQVVVLVIDGLGTNQLATFTKDAPVLSSLSGTNVSSVAPTTTATALTSIASGMSPLDHGILGYRMRLGNSQVFNSLLWSFPDSTKQPGPATDAVRLGGSFMDLDVSVVSKAQYSKTGFTRAYLGDGKFHEFRHFSTMVGKVKALLSQGKPLVYTYYEGLDSVAHEYGLSEFYVGELRFLDFLVAALIEVLPRGAALVITADHGQVEVPQAPIQIDPKLEALTILKSGEGRFRWLHIRNGALRDAKEIADDLYGDLAWIMTREETLESGLFGKRRNNSDFENRLGDLALIAREDVAFHDENDKGPLELLCRHGSMTEAETKVPLIGYLAV